MRTTSNMKRLVTMLMAFLLTLGTMGVSSRADINNGSVDVRVNGYLVNFPDQAPYINKDGRTLIPVRFVAEELGAAVSWDANTKTAIIEKDGVTIHLTIGKRAMTVSSYGANGYTTETIQMDTEATLTGGRTMVPIRFVAEALGAWVGYSDSFRTVQISNGDLTPAEIDELHDLAFSWDFHESKLKYKNSSTTFEDLHELAFREYETAMEFTMANPNDLQIWDSKKDTKEELANLYVRYIKEAVGNSWDDPSWGVSATFRTDASCMFSQPISNGVTPYICYGYLTLTFADDAEIAKYKDFHKKADFGNIQAGGTYTYIIEVQYSLRSTNSGRHSVPWANTVKNRTNGSDDIWR